MNQRQKRGHGEGQIIPISKSEFQWRVWVTYPSGERLRLSGTAKSRREAEEAKSAALTAAAAGRTQDAKTLTIAEMVAAHMQAKEQEWSFRSTEHNAAIYQRHMKAEIGAMKAIGMRPPNLRAYYLQLTAKGLGWSSQHQIHSLLSGAFKQAVGDGLLQDNPTLHARPIKPRRAAPTKKAFDFKEAQCFYEAAVKERWALPLAFMLLTGLRPGETIGLQWSDLTEDTASPLTPEGHPTAYWAKISRTRSECQGKAYESPTETSAGHRDILITDEALVILNRMLDYTRVEALAHDKPQTPYVFPSVNVTPLRQDTLRQVMQRICDLAGVARLSPHKLRHTFASLMHANRANVGSLSSQLGHANITTTLTFYRTVFREERRNMVLNMRALPSSTATGKAEPIGDAVPDSQDE